MGIGNYFTFWFVEAELYFEFEVMIDLSNKIELNSNDFIALLYRKFKKKNSRWLCMFICVWLVLTVVQRRWLYRHLCVCRVTADVFESDKSVWLRKRRSEDQTAEPHRSAAWERRRSLQIPAEKPSASCEPSSKHTTLHTSTTLKRRRFQRVRY